MTISRLMFNATLRNKDHFAPLLLLNISVCAVLQVTVKLFKQIADQGVPPVVMPAIGGCITGLVAVQFPEVLYQGFGNVNAILQNRDHFPPLLLFQILAVKILCTSVSKGSGLVGGTYAPSIFMGELLPEQLIIADNCAIADLHARILCTSASKGSGLVVHFHG